VTEKIVLVTRPTRLEELIARFNTRGQAKFYIEHAGGDFGDYERAHDAYARAHDAVWRALEFGVPKQEVDRALVPTFLFGNHDVVVTLGQDGLVANTAKYAIQRPLVAVNPDPERFDGILLPFAVEEARGAVGAVFGGAFRSRSVTLAEARLNDGQRLLAFNDLFIGARSHVSARYRLRAPNDRESQSSSGILVSTGAGSTGRLSSVFTMAAGITSFCGGSSGVPVRLGWEDRRLVYVVREPFTSRHSSSRHVAGWIDETTPLVLDSLMPSGGVIFSDGVESDFLRFDAGAVATIGVAAERATLVSR
jgi:hypothetical protein